MGQEFGGHILIDQVKIHNFYHMKSGLTVDFLRKIQLLCYEVSKYSTQTSSHVLCWRSDRRFTFFMENFLLLHSCAIKLQQIISRLRLIIPNT